MSTTPPPHRPAGSGARAGAHTRAERVLARRRAVRRRRLVVAGAVLAVLAGTLTTAVALSGGARVTQRRHVVARASSRGRVRTDGAAHPASSARSSAGEPTAVGLRIVEFIDRSRVIRFANRAAQPRTLVTEVRYPAFGRSGANDLRDAPARPGPYPLVIFGHGFAVTPAPYALLLDAWARAGYVVAAPVFPLGNARAPGGPNEADLVNQPADVRFVITQMLAESTRTGGPLSGLIARRSIAVTGQSDGGDTALAVAYDPALHDNRVNAAIILSGAEIPQLGPFAFPGHGPPLLATQGSADTINQPSATNEFFTQAPRPKYLLTLIGATHLPPYTDGQPQLGIVERVTVAFLDHYLKRRSGALAEMLRAARVPGVATLLSDR
jgi:predicted dienelactone hydrolase